MPTETEVKIRVSGFEGLSQRLEQLGFHLQHQRSFEANLLLDTEPATLRSQGTLLRLRTVAHGAVLTYKGPSTNARHKSREEIETGIAHPDRLLDILAHLGYRPAFRYEKYRTEYTDSKGVVTLDETPIGNFLELEGQPDWIDETALKLGHHPAEYVTKSYGGLYLEYCREHGLEPAHMVF